MTHATTHQPDALGPDLLADPLPGDTETRRLADALYRQTALDHLLSRAPATQTPRFAQREALVDALWACAPFDAPEPRPLPEIDAADLTLPRFLDVSHGHHAPVVIRGFGTASPAVQTWSADRLAERVGPLDITAVEVDHAPGASAAERGRTLHDMPLTDFVRRMHHEPLYLHNSGDLTAACPALVDELELELDRVRETLCAPGETWDPLFTAALFIGTERVYSNMHTAPGGNFFLQVTGRKTWTLVHPGLSPYVFPLIARPFNHARSAYGTFHTAAADSPLHRLPRYTVTLEPGDLLYNAPWWWHEVLNHGETIGCAMRYVAPPLGRLPTWRNHRLFAGLSLWPRLWAASLWDYTRHRARRAVGREQSGTLRQMVSQRTDRAVNQARGRRGS